MIVLQIQIDDVTVPKPDGQAPIAGNADAPGPCSLAFQFVNALAGWAENAADVLRQHKRGDHLANPARQIAANRPVIVLFDQASQSAMSNRSEPHVTLYGITVQSSSELAP